MWYTILNNIIALPATIITTKQAQIYGIKWERNPIWKKFTEKIGIQGTNILRHVMISAISYYLELIYPYAPEIVKLEMGIFSGLVAIDSILSFLFNVLEWVP